MTPFERLWKIMIKPWVVVIWFALIIISFLYLDRPIAYFFHNHDVINRFPILNWITKLGLGALYYIPLFVIALLVRYLWGNKKWELRIWFMWWCVALPSFICLPLKILFGRARPGLLFYDHIYGFYGLKGHAPYWSFPSGHTTTIMGLAFGLSILIPSHTYLFIVIGLLIATLRVLLTYHYLADVLAASYFVLIELGLFVYWLRQHKQLIFSENQG